jgi:biotin carboxyl carrier protein
MKYHVDQEEGHVGHDVGVNGNTITIGDATYTITATDTPDVYLLTHDGVETPMLVHSDGISSVTVHLRGQSAAASVLPEHHHTAMSILAASPALKNRSVKIAAPMPGLLRSVLVADGAHVKKGDVLFTLEAMKMENMIKAPINGVVRALSTQANVAVEKGTPLCTIEASEA